jgi:cell division protease FtsH
LGNARNVAFWVILFLLILALFNLFSGGQSQMNQRSVAYSDFIQQVENGQVVSATLDGERVQFTTGDGSYSTVAPLTPTRPKCFWKTTSGSRRRRRSNRAS